MKSLPALAFGLALVGTPLIADTQTVAVTAYGTSESFFDPLRGDLIVITAVSEFDTFEPADGSDFIALANGQCFGSVTVLGGAASGGGNCVFSDEDGHRILQRWSVDHLADDVAYGTWTFLGGTGPHTDLTGRGHFSLTVAPISGQVVNEVIGIATYPD
ncbi:MAG: hypothetical protein AAF914_04555 [Pseudomonadota bacterium]